MISEREISEKFTAIWKQHFPLLTANYMRVFNDSQVKNINLSPAPIYVDVRYDLISEVAFRMAELVNEHHISPEEYLSNQANVNSLLREVSLNIWRSDNLSIAELELSQAEKNDTISICNNIIEFISLLKVETCQFRPNLKGYSFISSLEADLEIDNSLYEIKTVNRNFKSTDLKQLFLYLALRQVSESSNWKYAGLYNPRKGTYCKFEIKTIISALSGGQTPNEVFDALLNSLVRDLQVDSAF